MGGRDGGGRGVRVEKGKGRAKRKREGACRSVRVQHHRCSLPVAPLVVVPRHQLHEVAVEGDACLGIKDARPGGDAPRWGREPSYSNHAASA